MWYVTQDYIKGRLSFLVEDTETGERVGEFDWQARAQEFAYKLNSCAVHGVSDSERSESLRCAKMGQEFAQGIADAFEKENALKLIDSLETTNGALRRSIILSDAIMSIGKETT